jgi:hypothetical protein
MAMADASRPDAMRRGQLAPSLGAPRSPRIVGGSEELLPDEGLAAAEWAGETRGSVFE